MTISKNRFDKAKLPTGKPEKKEETAWGYEIKAEFLDLPAHEMQAGVCDISGERRCGWGSFVAVVITKPPEEARKHLKKKFGTDFPKEKREIEFRVTLRPVLSKGNNPGEFVLFCGPGNL